MSEDEQFNDDDDFVFVWDAFNLKQRVEHSILLHCVGMDTLGVKYDDADDAQFETI